jgi:hypothetical protein
MFTATSLPYTALARDVASGAVELAELLSVITLPADVGAEAASVLGNVAKQLEALAEKIAAEGPLSRCQEGEPE